MIEGTLQRIRKSWVQILGCVLLGMVFLVHMSSEKGIHWRKGWTGNLEQPGPFSREILAVDDTDFFRERFRATHSESISYKSSKKPESSNVSTTERSQTSSGLQGRVRVHTARHPWSHESHSQDKKHPPLTYHAPLWSKSAPTVEQREKVIPCEQGIRRKRVEETCQKLALSGSDYTNKEKLNDKFALRGMLVDEKHKTLYCEVPKAACTSWKVFMANITGRVKPENQSRLFQLVHDTTYHPKIGFRYLSSYSRKERDQILKTYFKFIVVRNPYTRFLSAFENKFYGEVVQNEWYRENVGTYIAKHYGQGGKANTKDNVSFEQLSRFISNPNERDRNRFDAHFWKMQASCWPCLIHYDYIAKVETMDYDAANIINTIVPDENRSLPFLNKNRNASHERNKVKQKYQTLSDELLRNLSAIYANDLEMFGYKMDGEKNVGCGEKCC